MDPCVWSSRVKGLSALDLEKLKALGREYEEKEFGEGQVEFSLSRLLLALLAMKFRLGVCEFNINSLQNIHTKYIS